MCWECDRDANDLFFFIFGIVGRYFGGLFYVYQLSSVCTAGAQQVPPHRLAFRIPPALARLAKAHSISGRRAAEEDRSQAVVAVAACEEDRGSGWSASCRSWD